MKFPFTRRPSNNAKKIVLFVCVENAGRSQMAEAFFRKYAPNDYTSISAGTVPTHQINLITVEAMKKVGIDISNQKPKDLTEDIMRKATKIVPLMVRV